LYVISILSAVSFLASSSFAADDAAKAHARVRRDKENSNRVIASSQMPEFTPDTPESAYTQDRDRMISAFPTPEDPGLERLPTIDFCSEWNPEFPFNGHRCCRSIASARGKKTRVSCFINRPRGGYCDEVTDEQKQYIEALESSKPPFDPLDVITQDMGRKDQAYCTANNGFLAYGRPIVPSQKNRIQLRSPERCTQFGTDNMVGMVEWLGRQIGTRFSAPEYSGVHLLLGDVSAPRGGCLAGSSGRHGHLSHTNGSDADIGLLNVTKNRRSPASFSNSFDAKENWWMIKQIFHNPYACVKVIFLDRRHIRKLAKVASRDEEWHEFGRFIRHQKGHRNHMHVRIGTHPGSAGCAPGANPDLEEEAEIDDFDEVNSEFAHPVSSSEVGTSDESSIKSDEAPGVSGSVDASDTAADSAEIDD
jgi:murein endopeptidase